MSDRTSITTRTPQSLSFGIKIVFLSHRVKAVNSMSGFHLFLPFGQNNVVDYNIKFINSI